MFGTEYLKGQGFGNQLFCYITSRCLAADRGFTFATAGQSRFAYNIHNQSGLYFMDLDLGLSVENTDFKHVYHEKNDRLHLLSSEHDLLYGIDVSTADSKLHKLADDTLIYGNLQDETYFLRHKAEIKQWLQVKPEYDCREFSKENICIINFRGGEYSSNAALYLTPQYWRNAISKMLALHPDLNFVVITDDPKRAKDFFPEFPVYHFDLAKDYSIIKNAYYTIVSNSSFSFFPIFTSDVNRMVIAPKYWARHNISDGYWSSGQNIYTGWNYLDREGQLFSAQTCRDELKVYQQSPKSIADHSNLEMTQANFRTKNINKSSEIESAKGKFLDTGNRPLCINLDNFNSLKFEANQMYDRICLDQVIHLPEFDQDMFVQIKAVSSVQSDFLITFSNANYLGYKIENDRNMSISQVRYLGNAQPIKTYDLKLVKVLLASSGLFIYSIQKNIKFDLLQNLRLRLSLTEFIESIQRPDSLVESYCVYASQTFRPLKEQAAAPYPVLPIIGYLLIHPFYQSWILLGIISKLVMSSVKKLVKKFIHR